MSEETRRLMAAAHDARYRLKIGACGYDEAKQAVQVYVDHVNRCGRKIYGKRFRPVSTSGFLR